MNKRVIETGPEPAHELSDFDRLVARTGSEPEPGTENPVYSDTAPQFFDFADRPARKSKPRGTVLDWISLPLALLAPPLGLLLNLVSRILSRRTHGWTTTVAKVVTPLSIVFILVAGVGLVAYSDYAEDEAARAGIIAQAQPLCVELAKSPGFTELPAYGWPTGVATIPITLDSMKAYQARWQQLADLAPAGAKANVQAIADQAQTLVASVETNRAIDRNGNLVAMSAVTDASGLPGWIATHCG